MKTQHQKIIDMCSDGNWHCGNEFRAMFIFSPHKRRSEISAKGEYSFEDMKCEHGHQGVRDYRMKKAEALKQQKYFVSNMNTEEAKQLSIKL